MKYSETIQRLHQQQNNSTKNLHKETIQSTRVASHRKDEKVRKHCMLRIEKYFKQVVCSDIVLQCCIDTVMEILIPEKIVISSSSKRIVQDKKQLLIALAALKMISGQKSQATRARKSIAAFKLREGNTIGCKVTLRGKVMYSFLDKLLFLILPRALTFFLYQCANVNSKFNIGINDPFLFIELESQYDLFNSLRGIDIALVIPTKQKLSVQVFLSGLQIKL